VGLGRRTFAPGEVLTSSNVMNYLMDQSVMNFAGSAARGSAIGTAVSEGMVSYLNDTNALEVYRTSGTVVSWDRIDAPQSPNVIINGGFDIWQRGTSFTGNVYTADRWYGGNTPSAIARSTDVPNGFTYSIDITGANHLLGHRVESFNSVKLRGGPITVSFWAKSVSGTNTFSTQIGTPSATDNFTTSNIEYTSPAFTLTTSWARYQVSYPALSADIAKGLFIYLYRNGATAGDQTRITGVQVESGSSATVFRTAANSVQGELAACQRYFQSWNEPPLRGVVATAGQAWRMAMPLIVQMRGTPGVSVVGTLSVFDGTAALGTTGITVNYTTSKTVELDFSNGAGLTQGRAAVMYQNSGAGTLNLSAEL